MVATSCGGLQPTYVIKIKIEYSNNTNKSSNHTITIKSKVLKGNLNSKNE